MSNEHPLQGRIFCCSGIQMPEREDIVSKIKSLGGIHYSDLMSDVTYLIVGEKHTAKYKFCIENRSDVNFLLPSAIYELYKKWINGEKELSKFNLLDYKVPLFQNLKICVSRIEISPQQVDDLFHKASFRSKYYPQFKSVFEKGEQMVALINKYDGHATESLRLSNSCVISTELKGKRYQKALEWKTPVLHPIYIIDCIIRGAPLDFDYYIVTKSNINSLFPNASKVWNTVVAETNEVPTIYRPLPSVTNSNNAAKPLKLKKNAEIWNSIMSHTKSLQSLRSKRDTVWDQEEDNDEDEDENNVDQEGIEQQSLLQRQNSIEPPSKNELFLGFNFLLIGFTDVQNPLLIKVIVNHGGEITNESNDLTITHIILPSSIGNSKSVQMLKILSSSIKSKINNNDIKIVTEWFIERSIFYKSIIYDEWSQPIKGLIKSDKKFKVCLTGFTGIELLHIEKLIDYLGFEFCDSLTNDKELLIININLFKASLSKNSPSLFRYKFKDVINCPTYQIPSANSSSSVSIISSKNKINAAKTWQIPIVSLAYLWEIMELSINKDKMVMPDILDLKWCIYAPSSMARPHSMLEYVRKMTSSAPVNQQLFKRTRDEEEPREDSEGDHDDKSTAAVAASSDDNKENSSSVMRLPSPRKAKKKQKYGRIVGRESEDSLSAKLLKVSNGENYTSKEGDSLVNISLHNRDPIDDHQHYQRNPDVTLEDDDNLMSQVGYQATDSGRHNEALLNDLGGTTEVVESDEDTASTRNRRQQRNVKKVGKYSK